MSVRKTARLNARARIFALGTSTFVLSAMLLIIPVVGGYADPPHAIKSNVQNIALGAPEAPAKDVAVVDASQNPAPAPKATDGPAGVQPPTIVEPPKMTPKAEPSSPSSPSASPSSPSASPSSSSSGPAASASASSESAVPSGSSNGASPSVSSSSAPPSASSGGVSPPTADDPTPGASGATTMVLSADSTQNFSMVGVTWKGATPLAGIAVQVRTKSTSGKWSEWTDMSVDYTQTGKANEPVGTDPFWVGSSAGVEVTVTIQTGIKINGAKITLIDPNKQAQDSAGASKPTASAGADSPMPPAYSRAQWGADESLATWGPSYAPTIKAATVHHTADSNNYSAADVPGIMRSIYYYQAVTRGWGDIGYNVVVDKFGQAWEGRKGGLASTVMGAHAGGFNQYTFGVSMLGNYDQVGVPSATAEMVSKLIAWKFSIYGVDPTGTTQLTQQSGAGTTAKFKDGQTITLPTIFGHRDVGNTACPGQYGYSMLPPIRNRVAQIMTQYASPRGVLESVAATGRNVTLSGWSFDPTAISSTVSIAVYRNGVGLGNYPANTPRPDVANVFGIPGNHGYSINLLAEPAGTNTYCTYALDIEGLGNKTLGCQTVFVGPLPPVGALDAVSTGTSQIVNLRGWAFDPSSTNASVKVAVYRNGIGLGNYSLTSYRPDVNAAYSLTGNRGYDLALPSQPGGTNTYCVYALDTEAVANTTLGCRTITVQSRSPLSNYESLQTAGGQVILSGWSFDPDDPSRQGSVALYKDGVGIGWFQTTSVRSDVNAGYGIAGSHGFTISLPQSGSTPSSYCLYAIDSTDSAKNSFIGCRVG